LSKKRKGEKMDDAGRDLAPGLTEGATHIKKGIEAEKDKIVKGLKKEKDKIERDQIS
jgi:hypothetical protein